MRYFSLRTMSNVIVIGDDFGGVVGILDEETGYVLVKQLIEKQREDGSYDLSVRAAFINGSQIELNKYKQNQELPGRIVLEESLVPPKGKGSYSHREIVINGKNTQVFGYFFYSEDPSIEDRLI